MNIKKYLQSFARKCGLEIVKYTPTFSDTARMKAIFTYHQIDLVLDVGANQGQYAKNLRKIGYQGKIISFEPLSVAHKKLLEYSQTDKNWIIAPRVAIGQQMGTSEINIAENSYSSSLLPILETHVQAAPESRYIGKESVDVVRLDVIAKNDVKNSQFTFLKIDTQGFEQDVLIGAEFILPFIKGIQVELSLVELYAGQSLFLEIIQKLADLGYDLYTILPGFSDDKSGQLLQMDGIFFKKVIT